MEKEYDGELNEYMEVRESEKKSLKQSYWDVAIGLQKVDGLTPSKYMQTLVKKNIQGEVDNSTLETMLKKYYENKELEKNDIQEEKECDLVSARIVELLENDEFELSIDFLKKIHQYLFQDIYSFYGNFRNVDITKKEPILNEDTVVYSSYEMIEKSLEYDISKELEIDYQNMNIVEVINHIASFSSSIWQVHPFREGNTRVVAVFIIKYLRYLGYSVDNDLFKEKSVYFRNALVRSNYFNNQFHIREDNRYLIKFYENLLLGKNHNLQSRDLMIKELFEVDDFDKEVYSKLKEAEQEMTKNSKRYTEAEVLKSMNIEELK